MKTSKFCLSVLLLIGLVACKPTVKYSIEGNIQGLGSDTLYVEYKPISNTGDVENIMYDTLIAADGVFASDKLFDETVLWILTPKQAIHMNPETGETEVSSAQQIELLVGPEESIKIEGNMKPGHLSYKAIGTEFAEVQSKIREESVSVILESEKLWKDVEKMWTKAQTETKGAVDKTFDSLVADARAMSNRVSDIKLNYVKEHPDSEMSAFYLSSLPTDTVGAYYPSLGETAKNGIFKSMLDNSYQRFLNAQKIRENAKIVISGTQAPEFSLMDIQGKEVSLSSLKGKYIVLDFWGSWCSWCIKGIPEMKKYYAKYEDKVEFVGIACREKEETWKLAVTKYELPWMQLINAKAADKDVAVMYGVQGYPTKFILDKNLKIVAKVVGESPEFYQELDRLLKK